MRGLITGRHVLRHAIIIIRCWGVPTFARCLWAVLTRRSTTFLTVIHEGERYPASLGDPPPPDAAQAPDGTPVSRDTR
jgi:hypothetical protein